MGDYYRIKFATRYLKERGCVDTRMVVVEWLSRNKKTGKYITREYSSHMQTREGHFMVGGYFRSEKAAYDDCVQRMVDRPWMWGGFKLNQVKGSPIKRML